MANPSYMTGIPDLINIYQQFHNNVKGSVWQDFRLTIDNQSFSKRNGKSKKSLFIKRYLNN